VESKSEEAQRDTRFILKVQLTTKVAYVSIEVPTKGWVSFNANPPELPPRSTWFSTINPHEEEGNTNFSGLNHKPWELPGDA
jgi:hypothetical protein